MNELNLHFTSVISREQVNYLDVTVMTENGRLKTKLFRKSTAGNSILHGTSSHPRNLLNSIPYGELLRAKRNCTLQEDYKVVECEMLNRLSKRGYPRDILKRAQNKVEKLTQVDLLNSHKIRKDEDVVGLITTFSSDTGRINNILTRNWHILKVDPVIGKALWEAPQITYRKSTALRDLLVNSHFNDLRENSSEMSGFFPCMNCKACRYSKKRAKYKVPEKKECAVIKKLMNCNTDYVVYCLECPCGKQYIGSTIKKARFRILEHMRAIANKDRTYPVARHYETSHNSNRDLVSYYCLDRVELNPRQGDRTLLLRQLESRYIILLRTKMPRGLNIGEELSVHL